MAIFNDPTFWVAVAVVIFVALVYKPRGGAIAGALDAALHFLQQALAVDVFEDAVELARAEEHAQVVDRHDPRVVAQAPLQHGLALEALNALGRRAPA